MLSLSQDQIDAYFDRIALPQNVRGLLREGPDGADALAAITHLQQYHTAAIPFENIQLHYSSHRSVPQEMELVFDNVVVKGRGGVCPQVHQLYSLLLRSLGFTSYCSGGRINAPASPDADPRMDITKPSFGPWSHVNNVVVIKDRKYVVDTTFGQFGSPIPIPLVHDEPFVDIYPRRRRVIYASIPGLTDADKKMWRVQQQATENDPWMDTCCFYDTEWLPFDFLLMIAGLAQIGAGWYPVRVHCYRALMEQGKPVGYIFIFHDELKRYYKGKHEILQKFYTEADRIAALAEHFNINLDDREQKMIIGTQGELKDESFDFYSED